MMIFPVRQLVSYLSQFMTLMPGDLICTGTPSAVGLGHKPPTFLRPDQSMRLGITGLGEQRQIIVNSRSVKSGLQSVSLSVRPVAKLSKYLDYINPRVVGCVLLSMICTVVKASRW
jgi:hypothetical protein